MNRFEATTWLVQQLEKEAVVSNLGRASADLYAAGDRSRHLYLWGSMGLTASVGLGVALARQDLKIIVLDGDGSILMNLGTFATIADQAPPNLIHIVWDNEMWQETGGQPTHTSRLTDLGAIALGAGIQKVSVVRQIGEFQSILLRALKEEGPWSIIAKVEEGGDYHPLPGIEAEISAMRFRHALIPIADADNTNFPSE